MDERIFPSKCGQPIPEWDGKHRLRIEGKVGPVIADDGTIFRINSNYMDVSDEPFGARQWIGAAAFVSFATAIVGLFFSMLPFLDNRLGPQHIAGSLTFLAVTVPMTLGFGYLTVFLGRDEFFSLTRRTIRFHRKEKKIFLIRRRRFFAKPGEGDICWEVPWSERTIFCVHKGKKTGFNNYQIMGYVLDDKVLVERAFAIGKDWLGDLGLEYLLAQWNYYCTYMNDGPAALPSPMLYLSEDEDIRESFLHCVYEIDHTAGIVFRVLFMPAFLGLTCFRVLSLSTCRAPIWPEEVDRLCRADAMDAYAQPSGSTPRGWAATIHAKHRNEYPHFPRAEILGWTGPSESKNAELWAEDVSPLNDKALWAAEAT
ncbi:DUF6708 domain-containing protein [Pseudoduganella violaceinigra]|uniref:DUF6708 domain-containing protein n=1 Tax=Pseudoduganella violaceinigra TaxID=246602 RepID=UPI000485C5B2|nr:DUF6708 domain-containing protein [Pseudoduganella violaceinigra]